MPKEIIQYTSPEERDAAITDRPAKYLIEDRIETVGKDEKGDDIKVHSLIFDDNPYQPPKSAEQRLAELEARLLIVEQILKIK